MVPEEEEGEARRVEEREARRVEEREETLHLVATENADEWFPSYQPIRKGSVRGNSKEGRGESCLYVLDRHFMYHGQPHA